MADGLGGDRRRGRRDQRGAAAVEFALVLVPLLIILFGIIQYGFYFWAMQGGSDIARDAARRAAVGSPAACTPFKDAVKSEIDSLVGSGKVVGISRTFDQDATLPRTSATDVVVSDRVRVQVTFKGYDFHFPFVPFIHDGVVTSSAEARVENVTTQPGLTCS
ncbi:TadE/TadG family type IV pilus assembly protein [Nocardioides sp. CER19]|uniref:TadE/TadG family type IV pilus assembly protein n=1 Tax=Nocardioides sp. CER19 TaxID=3038538 RepID=UPI00244D1229|nr:TadE/TadG family type IV pilus assembly protein [Nocardioides sp. CER19]MDH2416314.1 TadE/TadG family type IV pilus assembly protein [Nocardioides sp. CER19]